MREKSIDVHESTDFSVLIGKKILGVKVFDIYEASCENDRSLISFNTNSGTYDFYTSCNNGDCGCSSVCFRLCHDNLKDGEKIKEFWDK